MVENLFRLSASPSFENFKSQADALDQTACDLLHDPSSGSFKYQTLLFSIHQSSGDDDLQTLVLLNRRLCLYFDNLTFQPNQWFCGPFLDQRSRSPLGLRTSEISILKLYFSSKYADYCHVSSWIRRLRLTSGLYPESTRLFHVFSGSDSQYLLQRI
jgi:hypothetical protein